jgi:hypothetical protein
VLGIPKLLGRLGIRRFACKVSILFITYKSWREGFTLRIIRGSIHECSKKIRVNLSGKMVLPLRTFDFSS